MHEYTIIKENKINRISKCEKIIIGGILIEHRKIHVLRKITYLSVIK